MTSPKGLPFDSVGETGWTVFDDGVAYPVAVLLDSALRNNSAAMRQYCERLGVSVAPHGKTTMAPALFRRQLDDGAWGITAATAWQAKTMRELGVDRVLIANEVVVPAEIEWLSRATDEGFEVYCYVDSLAGVEIMNETLERLAPGEPLRILLEAGIVGGRTGVRTVEEGLAVAEAVAASPCLELCGVSGFEGILSAADGPPAPRVDAFLTQMVELVRKIAAEGWFHSSEVLVTAGGSAYFDQVAARLTAVDIDQPTRVVLRSGCYLTHDDGGYARSSPMGDDPRIEGPERLMPAIEIWGAVLSRPEPTRALVGLGKRDTGPEALLPLAKKVRRRGSDTVESIEPVRVTAMNDQHAYLDLDPSDPLAVGDLIGFGISHPCTTFDKWRTMVIVDDDYVVREVIDTYF